MTLDRDRVVFIDAGPLISFAVTGQIDLLGRHFENDQPIITSAVHQELQGLVRTFPALHTALNANWLTRVEVAAVANLNELDAAQAIDHTRRRFARLGDSQLKHLGEAETIVAAKAIGPRTRLITEDRDARDHANAVGLRAWWTTELLGQIYVAGHLPCTDVKALYAQMRQAGRSLPPGLTDYDLCP